jgi:uncharacterized protein
MINPIFGGYGLYILFSLPALLLGFWAQMKVRSAFKKYSRIRSQNGLTGAQIASRILEMNNLRDIDIEESKGRLSDHYDPGKKVLRLSPEVFRGNSIAAAGIAAHEVGHAIQHGTGYALLQLRTTLVPTVRIGSWLGPIIFMLGLFIQSALGTQIAWVGLILFAATAVFAILTLPVELDASRRAKSALTTSGLIYQDEMRGVNRVLNAAALTYVAAAIQAITTILYYITLLSGRRR